MGVNNSKETETLRDTSVQPKKEHVEIITKNSFDFVSIIGRGGFGKVWKVVNRKSRKEYAMKEMLKTKIIDKKSERSILSERELLSKMKHPFIVNMHYAFQDKDNLYLILDLLSGGDMRYHICKYRHFSEEEAKFILACIILGLEYCHYNKVIHRDIKPENLVCDAKGYVKITDFGIAKYQEGDLSKETSGTPGYMAPEVMCAQDHTVAVDSFALGVIGYEFMFERRPYLGKSRKEIKEKIIAKQVQIKRDEIPEGWTIEAADFINRLLRRKAWDRLGYNGVHELKEHIWLKNFAWQELYHGRLTAPFAPKDCENYDYKYCNAIEKQGLNSIERYQEIMLSDNYKYGFNDYSYFNREVEEAMLRDGLCVNPHETAFTKKRIASKDRNSESVLAHYNKNEGNRPVSSLGHHQRNISNPCNGASAFLMANSYVNKRHELKKNMSTLVCKQTSTTNLNSINSTGLNSIK